MNFFDDHIIISDMSSMFDMFGKAKENAPKKEGNKLGNDESIMKKHLSNDNKIESSLAMEK